MHLKTQSFKIRTLQDLLIISLEGYSRFSHRTLPFQVSNKFRYKHGSSNIIILFFNFVDITISSCLIIDGWQQTESTDQDYKSLSTDVFTILIQSLVNKLGSSSVIV